MNIKEKATVTFMKSLNLVLEPSLAIFEGQDFKKQIRYPGFGKRQFIKDTLRSMKVKAPVYQRLENEIALSKLR